jgi:hypothetical protein
MNWLRTFEVFAARLRENMSGSIELHEVNRLALELFELQFQHNAVYRRFCKSRGLSPDNVQCLEEIPAVPTYAFKEWDLSCIPEAERTAVFHSSGTTEHRPGRHFHNHESLRLYEASLLAWFGPHLLTSTKDHSPGAESSETQLNLRAFALTPDSSQAPNSSLVHMFETLRRQAGFNRFTFAGTTLEDGTWTLDSSMTYTLLLEAVAAGEPVLLLGAAFSYVHLLEHMQERNLFIKLPPGSRAMETGGYKGRSRALPKAELHSFITSRLGIPRCRIVCEYGMSELSSQAYDRVARPTEEQPAEMSIGTSFAEATGCFRFPPWVRVQIVSPETGREVDHGETGLIRVFDLANVYSVMAVQTEDLAVRRENGFELVGRTALAETRGCSLMVS